MQFRNLKGILPVVLIAVALIVTGCGSDADVSPDLQESEESQENLQPNGEADMNDIDLSDFDLSDPEQLGEAISQNYISVIKQVRDLTAELPDPDVLGPQLEELKEEYIQIFVELGHEVEKLDDTQRGRVDSALFASFGILEQEIGMDWMRDANQHYMEIDHEFASFFMSFNVITQYAFFDLLRQQEPEEAQRLGI